MLDLLPLPLLSTQLRLLGRSGGLACEPYVKVPAMLTNSVRQCMHHSRSARLGSGLDLSDTFFGARDQSSKVCNFLLVSREHNVGNALKLKTFRSPGQCHLT